MWINKEWIDDIQTLPEAKDTASGSLDSLVFTVTCVVGNEDIFDD